MPLSSENQLFDVMGCPFPALFCHFFAGLGSMCLFCVFLWKCAENDLQKVSKLGAFISGKFTWAPLVAPLAPQSVF